jgi:hypothetical protein
VPTSTTVEQLKAACDAAYDKHLNSCSHAVWEVIRGTVSPNEDYRQANELVDHLQQAWKEVPVDEAQALANRGIVVVGGATEAGHGHVVVVYPGKSKSTGGYSFIKAGKAIRIGDHGNYPLAMSTSLGSWPGAKSRGDKTVWDAWGSDAKFARVRFWTPKE